MTALIFFRLSLSWTMWSPVRLHGIAFQHPASSAPEKIFSKTRQNLSVIDQHLQIHACEFSCCIFRDQAGIFRDPAAAAPGELQKHRFRSILSPIFEQILTMCANRPDRPLPGGTVGTNVDIQELVHFSNPKNCAGYGATLPRRCRDVAANDAAWHPHL